MRRIRTTTDVCRWCSDHRLMPDDEETEIPCEAMNLTDAMLRLYVFERDTQLCGKCGTRVRMDDLRPVSALSRKVTKPATAKCLGCNGDGNLYGAGYSYPHTACDGRGFIVVGQHEREVWVYEVCTACVDEMAVGRNRPSGNGYAVVYTTASRAGEPQNRPEDGQRSRSAGLGKLCMTGCGKRVQGEAVICTSCLKRVADGRIRADMLPAPVVVRKA